MTDITTQRADSLQTADACKNVRQVQRLISTLIVVASAMLTASALSHAAERPEATTAAKAKPCRQVDVKLEPDGEGSGVGIRVWNVGCRKARRVVRHCIQGKVDDGWTAGVNADLSKITLKSGRRKITYRPAGGGGCAPV